MENEIVTDSPAIKSRSNWHARALAELFVITLFGVITFHSSTQRTAMRYAHARELDAQRLEVSRETQQLIRASYSTIAMESANQDLTPDPGKNLSPAEKRAIERSGPQGEWTE